MFSEKSTTNCRKGSVLSKPETFPAEFLVRISTRRILVSPTGNFFPEKKPEF
jgi:hypothetical protein